MTDTCAVEALSASETGRDPQTCQDTNQGAISSPGIDPPVRKRGLGPKRTNTLRTRDGNTVTLSYNKGTAIKFKCTECLGWDDNPKQCTDTMCPLFPFRGQSMATQRGE